MPVDDLILVNRRTTTATETLTLHDGFASHLLDATLELIVHSSSADTDTIDVKIQHSVDNSNWSDLMAWTQVAGTADDDGTQREFLYWTRTASPEDEAQEDTTSLTAGTVTQGPAGSHWRVVATIANNDDPSFIWSLRGQGTSEY